MTTPRTAEPAAALAAQHRQAQLQLRARVLRDFLILWPIWTGDDASFDRLVQATTTLVRAYRQGSSTLAGSYYTAARTIGRQPGRAEIHLAEPLKGEQLIRSMYITGQARQTATVPSEQERAAALTRVSGAVTRHVLDGGRETILQTVQADERAVGWARITDGDPCYFCLTLASRGAVYKTEQTADFQAHDHCGCSAMPLWQNTELPDATHRYREIYEAAQRAGVEDGSLQHGENTSLARLNAVRRYLARP